MFGSISKERSGRYRARYIGADGKRYSAGTYDRAVEAQDALQTIQEEIHNGLWVPPHARRAVKKLTVGEWCEQWLGIIAHTHKPSTVESHTRVLERRVLNVDGEAAELKNMPIESVRRKDIARWYDALILQYGNQPYNYSAYMRLRTAFNFALERELIKSNPVALPAGVKRPTEKKKELPSEADLHAIVDALDTRYKLVAVLTFFHGMRIGEVLALRRQDIEATERGYVVHVRGSSYRKPGAGMIRLDSPKTQAGVRAVPVFPAFNTIVQTHLNMFVSDNPDGLICMTSKNKPLMDTSYRSILKRAKTRAGVTADITPHYGRVWLITTLVEAGMPIPAIGELLGQRDLKTITEIYMRTSEAKKKQVLDTVNEVLGKSTTLGD